MTNTSIMGVKEFWKTKGINTIIVEKELNVTIYLFGKVTLNDLNSFINNHEICHLGYKYKIRPNFLHLPYKLLVRGGY